MTEIKKKKPEELRSRAAYQAFIPTSNSMQIRKSFQQLWSRDSGAAERLVQSGKFTCWIPMIARRQNPDFYQRRLLESLLVLVTCFDTAQEVEDHYVIDMFGFCSIKAALENSRFARCNALLGMTPRGLTCVSTEWEKLHVETQQSRRSLDIFHTLRSDRAVTHAVDARPVVIHCYSLEVLLGSLEFHQIQWWGRWQLRLTQFSFKYFL